MLSEFSAEFKVGLFVVISLAIVVLGYALTRDGTWPGGRRYTVSVVAPTAEGLYEGTPVRLAGVQIGVVERIALRGDEARLELGIDRRHRLPVDSTVELRTTGFLGDRFVSILLGRSSITVADGGVLVFGQQPGDVDAITRQVEQITQDLQAITLIIREVVEDRENREHVEQTLENVQILSAELRLMAHENRQDIREIVQGLGRLTDGLEAFSGEAREDVRLGMQKLHGATDRLDATLGTVQGIADKVDRGEGTLGALINDRGTVERMNEALDQVGGMFGGFKRLRAEVYYLGRLYLGTQPELADYFYGNPLAPNLAGGLGLGAGHTLGVRLRPQEDLWWTFEIVDHPQGRIRMEERYLPAHGVAYREYTRTLGPRFTFMLTKRWWDLAFRIGLMESSGGVGMSWYVLGDRVELRGDLFDFTFGSYPVIPDRGVPNLRVGARVTPLRYVWAEAGTEQLIQGIRHGNVTGYVGAGFHFTDDNIKMLFAFLPGGL